MVDEFSRRAIFYLIFSTFLRGFRIAFSLKVSTTEPIIVQV